jgi:hypothetical protein
LGQAALDPIWQAWPTGQYIQRNTNMKRSLFGYPLRLREKEEAKLPANAPFMNPQF